MAGLTDSEVKLVVKKPRSIDPDISVDVDISINGAEYIPFTAMPGDSAGDEIYQKALKGGYGKITLAPGSDYLWSGSKWVSNPLTDPVAEADALKQRKSEAATRAIAPLQYASDLGMATEAEAAMLLAWKKYSVLLSRVDTRKPVWPEEPGNVA